MICSLALTLLLTSASPDAAEPGPPAPNWPAVTAAARAYRSTPSSATARRLIGMLPHPSVPPPHEVSQLLWSLVATIQQNGSAGEASAIRLGFRLQAFSDAAFSEDLAVCLGSISTMQPTTFLATLAAVQPARDRPLDPFDVVIWFDPDLSDLQRATELDKRLKALRSVRDHRLRTVRDTCIARLTALPSTIP